jgi:hypothetical protein
MVGAPDSFLQKAHLPTLFSPTIGAAITAGIGSGGSAARLAAP